MSRKKIFYVISEVHNATTFEWVANSSLRDEFEFTFVLMNPGPTVLEDRLSAAGHKVIRVNYRGKRDIFSAFRALFVLFLRCRPDVVHTHLLAANIAGLTAAYFGGVPERIYTRHHTNLNRIGPWHARFYDWWPNFLATKIVATCENVRNSLERCDRVPTRKVRSVRFGFPAEGFRNVSAERVARVRDKHGFTGKYPVVGLISRYIPLKGVPHAISGFEAILPHYPNACLVLANAGAGEAKSEIQEKLARLRPGSFREISFEDDNQALLKAFDIFVHVPVDPVSEAFGQVYIEAMLSGIPSVFTLSGVAPEIVRDGGNALVVPYANGKKIGEALLKILGDEKMRSTIAANANREAAQEFSVQRMIQELRSVYL